MRSPKTSWLANVSLSCSFPHDKTAKESLVLSGSPLDHSRVFLCRQGIVGGWVERKAKLLVFRITFLFHRSKFRCAITSTMFEWTESCQRMQGLGRRVGRWGNRSEIRAEAAVYASKKNCYGDISRSFRLNVGAWVATRNAPFCSLTVSHGADWRCPASKKGPLPTINI